MSRRANNGSAAAEDGPREEGPRSVSDGAGARFLADVIRSANIAIIGVGTSARIVSWNGAAQTLFGYGFDEVRGRNIGFLFSPDRREELDSALAAALRGEIVKEIDTVRIDRHGGVLDVRVVVSPACDSKGDIVGASAIAQDITDRKAGQRALANKARELERSNAELEQFAYIASHDLQEPLRMVTGYTTVLLEEYGSTMGEEGRRFLSYAHESAERMQQLIRDLLAYARISRAGKPPKPVPSREALDRAIGDLNLAIEESGAEIVVDDPLPRVLADADQLAKVFLNLLGNAIKFCKDRPLIRIDAFTEADMIHFRVRDNGIGIDSRYETRIFEVFQRMHPRDNYEGTGMGLAICKRIIERLGGRIWVTRNPEGGSTFHFTTPAAD